MRTSYAASKHALHGFFDSLRAELGQTPIQITLICPGFIRTDISMNALTGDGSQQGKMDDATGKGMQPEILAHKILRAIERGKEEAYLAVRKCWAYILNGFSGVFFKIDQESESNLREL